MIIKVVGMLVVFASCSALGFALGDRYVRRERELHNLYNVIERMEGELSYSAMSVRDLFFAAESVGEGACAELMACVCRELKDGASAPTAWHSAISATYTSMSLEKSDCRALSSMAPLFGAYELREQQSHFGRIKSELGSLINLAEHSRKKNLRLTRMLGVYVGALACIIML